MLFRSENLRKHLLDLLAHVLRLTADVHISLAVEDRIRDVLPVFPDEVLHVDLASVGLVVLAGEGDVDLEFALELPFVFGPFVLVEEVLVVPAAAVEERDAAPVVERVWAVLFQRAAGESYTFLDKSAERSDTLGSREIRN